MNDPNTLFYNPVNLNLGDKNYDPYFMKIKRNMKISYAYNSGLSLDYGVDRGKT